jgi:hypothetical protein
MQMEDYIYQKDLWQLLGGKAKKPSAMSNEDWDILDRKELGSICLCLAPSMAFNISTTKTTKYLMSTLAKLYEKPSTSNKVFLMKCLFTLKMVEGESVEDHSNDFNTITSQLISLNIKSDEEVRDLLILCSLPESWNSLVMAVSNFVFGSNTLKLDDVIGVILSKEIHRKSLGSVLNTERRDRSKERGKRCGGRGKSRRKSRDKRFQSRDRKDC